MTLQQVAEQGNLVPVDAAAQRLNVSDKTIRRWIKEGHLPCVLVGPAKRMRIPESAIVGMLRGTDDKDAKA